jgi:hypothetical protein
MAMPEEPTDPSAPLAHDHDSSATGRRSLLALGAVSASMIVTVRPAIAQTAGSALACQIPIPDPGRAGQAIAADGTVVPQGTPGSVAAPARALTGDEVKAMLSGGSPAGITFEQRQAYTAYIRRLQRGTSGFTCYASLQLPRS